MLKRIQSILYPIPIWIVIFAILTMLTSVVGIVAGYGDASTFYPEYATIDWTAPHLKHLAGMWASKNLAIVVVTIFGLVRRDARFLASIFLFRFVSDSVDILVINSLYRGAEQAGLVTTVITYLILGFPSIVATIQLLRRAHQQEQDA